MRKTRADKGITLIALIITIVVLLILAVVTINSIKNDGIIDYATNARDDYQTKQDEEEDALQEYLDIMNSVTATTNPKVKVGHYVNYTPDTTQRSIEIKGKESGLYKANSHSEFHPYTDNDYIDVTYEREENIKWQVLKNDGKNIYLISEKPLNGGGANTGIGLSGMLGFENGAMVLKKVSSTLYGGSKAEEVRSIEEDDINNIFRPGFNPNLEKNWFYQDKTVDPKVELPIPSGTVTISDFVEDLELTISDRITLTNEQLNLKIKYYYFDPGNTKNTITAEESAKYKAKDEYNLIFNACTSSIPEYWVATPCVHMIKQAGPIAVPNFGLNYVKNGYMSQKYLGDAATCSCGYQVGTNVYRAYRPIIKLKSDVELVSAGEGTNTWNIK